MSLQLPTRPVQSASTHLTSLISFFFLNLFIYFIFVCVGSSLLHTGFLQLRRAGATLRCGARASHCGGFSCCGARALGVWASVVAAHGLSSCGSWAQLLLSMWDLPGSGLESVSPALAGGFLTTAPPGKPYLSDLISVRSPSLCSTFHPPQLAGNCVLQTHQAYPHLKSLSLSVPSVFNALLGIYIDFP